MKADLLFDLLSYVFIRTFTGSHENVDHPNFFTKYVHKSFLL
jgi:hypothetical protein